MKAWLALFLILSISSAWATSGKDVWLHSNTKTRVFLFDEYKVFFEELNKAEGEKYQEIQKEITFFFNIISEAWAAPEMNCIYAGWPSQKVGGLCSSPARMNPDYQKSSCSSNQLQCQPLLFGNGLCVPVANKNQRQYAFSNCNKEFASSKRSREDLVRELRTSGKEQQLFELMDFAEKICTEGMQAKTPMCKRLKEMLESVKEFLEQPMPEPESTTTPETLPEVVPEQVEVQPEVKTEPEVVVEGIKISDPEIKSDILRSVEVANEVVQKPVSVGRVEECPPEERVPFERTHPRPLDFNGVTTRSSSNPAWDEKFMIDRQDGYRFRAYTWRYIGPASPLDPSEKIERDWQFTSDDRSKRETYIRVTDDAGSGRLSQLMETIIVLIPRKTQPSTKVVGSDLHVVLPTGEKVIFDKNTKKIKSGAFKEGPVDLNPNRFNRKFASIDYLGKGISIRANRRGEDPRIQLGMAEIKQGDRTCKLPVTDLWNNADFRFVDDKELVEFLNKKCRSIFTLVE